MFSIVPSVRDLSGRDGAGTSCPSRVSTEMVPSFGSGTGTDAGDGRSSINIHTYFALLITNIQVTVAASPPFGGTQIDHLQLNSQVYLTPGFQVLEAFQKLGTLPDMISSPWSHFAVLEHVKKI